MEFLTNSSPAGAEQRGKAGKELGRRAQPAANWEEHPGPSSRPFPGAAGANARGKWPLVDGNCAAAPGKSAGKLRRAWKKKNLWSSRGTPGWAPRPGSGGTQVLPPAAGEGCEQGNSGTPRCPSPSPSRSCGRAGKGQLQAVLLQQIHGIITGSWMGRFRLNSRKKTSPARAVRHGKRLPRNCPIPGSVQGQPGTVGCVPAHGRAGMG